MSARSPFSYLRSSNEGIICYNQIEENIESRPLTSLLTVIILQELCADRLQILARVQRFHRAKGLDMCIHNRHEVAILFRILSPLGADHGAV
jgi:hypothetical protein